MKSQINAFLKTFGVKVAIVQAPMAGASTIELAATITKRGGIGSIPLGSYSEAPDVIEKQVLEFQRLVDDESLKRNVNLNFFTHEAPIVNNKLHQDWTEKFQKIYHSEEIEVPDASKKLTCLYPTFKSIDSPDHATIQMLVKLKPKIVSFHFGLPNIDVLKALQKSGIKVFVATTNLEEFKEVVEAGADGSFLQGWEAGGHRGNFVANDINDSQLKTEELVKKITEYVDTDVKLKSGESVPYLIAAGGLYDGKTIANILNYGVAGVSLGTIWLSTSSATVSKTHKELLNSKTPAGTQMNPAISGRNLRTIETEYLDDLKKDSLLDTIPDYPYPYSIFKQLASDSQKANTSRPYSAYLAGANYHKSTRNTENAGEVFDQLVEELKKEGYNF